MKPERFDHDKKACELYQVTFGEHPFWEGYRLLKLQADNFPSLDGQIAISLLGYMGFRRATMFVASKFRDAKLAEPDDQYELAFKVAHSLAHIDTSTSSTLIVSHLLAAETEEMQCGIIDASWKLSTSVFPAKELLEFASIRENKEIIKCVLWVLGFHISRLGEEAFLFAKKYLQDVDPDLCYYSAYTLVSLPCDQSLPLLAPFRTDSRIGMGKPISTVIVELMGYCLDD